METKLLPLPESQASRLARGFWGRQRAERPSFSLGAEAPSPALRSHRLSWGARRETMAVTIHTCSIRSCVFFASMENGECKQEC